MSLIEDRKMREQELAELAARPAVRTRDVDLLRKALASPALFGAPAPSSSGGMLCISIGLVSEATIQYNTMGSVS